MHRLMNSSQNNTSIITHGTHTAMELTETEKSRAEGP